MREKVRPALPYLLSVPRIRPRPRAIRTTLTSHSQHVVYRKAPITADSGREPVRMSEPITALV